MMERRKVKKRKARLPTIAKLTIVNLKIAHKCVMRKFLRSGGGQQRAVPRRKPRPVPNPDLNSGSRQTRLGHLLSVNEIIMPTLPASNHYHHHQPHMAHFAPTMYTNT